MRGNPSKGDADHSPSPEEDRDEGRRYWKAAIAHLAPEKRDAAWEFYLDRLESSPAADTLGGVMLLLEAHLAFFDDLPARLATAARQVQAVVGSPGGGPTPARAGPPSGESTRTNEATGTDKRRLRSWAIATISAAFGAVVASAVVFSLQHARVDRAARLQPSAQDVALARAHLVSVEPWYDSAIHRQRGCIVDFDRTAWTEHTSSGGAKVYVLSPVEEVRHEVESLRQLTSTPVSPKP